MLVKGLWVFVFVFLFFASSSLLNDLHGQACNRNLIAIVYLCKEHASRGLWIQDRAQLGLSCTAWGVTASLLDAQGGRVWKSENSAVKEGCVRSVSFPAGLFSHISRNACVWCGALPNSLGSFRRWGRFVPPGSALRLFGSFRCDSSLCTHFKFG